MGIIVFFLKSRRITAMEKSEIKQAGIIEGTDYESDTAY